jgi:hypothetical protein
MPVPASPSLQYIGEGFGGLEFWLRAHQQAHLQAAQATNTFLPVLDPFDASNPVAREGWLADHARAHNEVNAYLRIAGADLTELNWDDPREVQAWVDLNWTEHSNWSAYLP